MIERAELDGRGLSVARECVARKVPKGLRLVFDKLEADIPFMSLPLARV